MSQFARALAALLQFAPIGTWDASPWADVSDEAAHARYVAVAEAIDDVCEDWACASLLVAQAVGESGMARDTDEGPCFRKGAYRTRCDSGRAASVFQAQAFGVDETGEKITVKRLFEDRRLAAWQALRVARSSLARCGSGIDALSGLSGRCRTGEGPWRDRLRLWWRVRAWVPPNE